MTAAECKSDFKHTTDTSYLALTGDLLGVSNENFGENWPRYNGTALYLLFPNLCENEPWKPTYVEDIAIFIMCAIVS